MYFALVITPLPSIIDEKIKEAKGLELTETSLPGGGVLPYMGYIGMCGPKGYGFSVVLVINRVSI